MEKKNICILTFGTRGDVQPYIALGAGLQAAGYSVTVATLGEFKAMVLENGLQFDLLRGDFLKAAQAAEAKPASAGRSNPFKLVRQYIAMARETLDDEWASAQKADMLVYNLAALGGYHIAEKLGIPAVASFPAPLYSPTRAFPSPFLPFKNLGPLNKLSHRFFASLGPTMYRRPINQWRREALSLPPAKNENALNGKPVTKLYAYSPVVLPPPADWDSSTIVTGYWFLKTAPGWEPDPALVDFLDAGPPPVYVGFGSMFMGGGSHKTDLVLQALRLAGQRGLLASGWGGLAPGDLPEGFWMVPEAPHDWLFPRMTAIVHHGGAGTSGAALQAGKPSVVCPFVGDQFFWGRRLAELGAGPSPISRGALTAERLAEAIRQAVSDPSMRQRAVDLGKTVRSEDGVGRAVEVIKRLDLSRHQPRFAPRQPDLNR